MKLTFVMVAWLSIAVGLYLFRFGLEAGREAVLNFANGFVSALRAATAMEIKGRSSCSPTLGEILGFIAGVLVLGIPATFLWRFFTWTIAWSLTN